MPATRPGPVIRLGDPARRLGRPRWIHRAMLFGIVLGAPRPALAQEAVVQVPKDLFDPAKGQGVRIGSGFVLQPELTAEGIYDSNIYNIETAPKADSLVSLRPRFVLASDFARHKLTVSGGADIRRYAKYGGEDSTTADLEAKGLLELGDWIYVEPAAAIWRGVELRGTAGDQFLSDRPVVYNHKEARLAIWRTVYRLGITLNGRIGSTSYENTTIAGVPVDLSGRDLSTADGSIRVDLAVSDRVKLYAKASANRLAYRKLVDKKRDSSGYALLVGAHIQITNLVDAEVAAGYIRQNFSDASFRPVSALDWSLVANWTPRPTWKVTAGANRAVDASPRNDTAAIFRSTFHLSAQHVLTDRLLVEASGAHIQERYLGIDRTDRRFEAALGVQYRLAARIGVTAKVGYRHQTGGIGGPTYDGAAASVSLRFVL